MSVVTHGDDSVHLRGALFCRHQAQKFLKEALVTTPCGYLTWSQGN